MNICLLGTDFNSANRGCGALGYSAIEMLYRVSKEKNEELRVIAFVWETCPIPVLNNDNISLELLKMEPKTIKFWKKSMEYFKKSDFVIDFTGGDSFSDIYGKKRFYILTAMKQFAIWSRTPFIMGPQTIGPFDSWMARTVASHILKKSKVCFVRDRMSFEYVQEIASITPLLTTDVAFALPYEKIEKKIGEKRKIGFNPSGLLWAKNNTFQAEKHLCVDYRKYVKEVMQVWSQDESCEIYLIPHVFSRDTMKSGDDLAACRDIQKEFPNVKIADGYNTPMEAKSFISNMDVFIGARMHATIAAISSGVVTIPFSYSRKFEGLYQDLDYPYIISGKEMSTREAIEKTLSWVCDPIGLEEKIKLLPSCVADKQRVFYDALNNL